MTTKLTEWVTIPQEKEGGIVKYLYDDKLNVICDPDFAISRAVFERSTDKPQDIRYNYTCRSFPGLRGGHILPELTDEVPIGNGDISVLKGSKVDCENTAITSFRLRPTTDNTKIYYEYHCGDINLKSLGSSETPYFDVGDGNNYEQTLYCSGNFLTSFNLESKPNDDKQYRYVYSCGTMETPPSPVWYKTTWGMIIIGIIGLIGVIIIVVVMWRWWGSSSNKNGDTTTKESQSNLSNVQLPVTQPSSSNIQLPVTQPSSSNIQLPVPQPSSSNIQLPIPKTIPITTFSSQLPIEASIKQPANPSTSGIFKFSGDVPRLTSEEKKSSTTPVTTGTQTSQTRAEIITNRGLPQEFLPYYVTTDTPKGPSWDQIRANRAKHHRTTPFEKLASNN